MIRHEIYFPKLVFVCDLINICLLGVSLYNGTKWKGMELKIEEAKSDHRDRCNLDMLLLPCRRFLPASF